MNNIKHEVRSYILKEHFSEDNGGELEDNTPLLSSGVLDSISALDLVEFLEKTYQVEFKAHEVDQDNLDSLERIEAFVQSKLSA